MNEEQSRRLADAADAVLQCTEAVAEAKSIVDDPRFASDLERERSQAAQQAAGKLDNAAKKVQDALRKAAVSAAASGRVGGYEAFQAGSASCEASRDQARAIANEDGSAKKQAKAQEAMATLEAALSAAVGLVFPST